jgi:hypothetical protein
VRTADRALLALAGAYFATVAFNIPDPGLHAGADAVAGGRLWSLITSALDPEGPLPLLQVAAAAGAAALLIACVGPLVWWAAALAGHVGSALVAYGAIGLASALGSGGAEHAAARPDFGISCVLGGTIGALLVTGAAGLHARRAAGRRPRLVDRAAILAGALGVLAILPFAAGWYGIEHPLAVVLGAAAAWRLTRRARAPRTTAAGPVRPASRPPLAASAADG